MNEITKIYTTLFFVLVCVIGAMVFSMIVKTNNVYQLNLEVTDLKKEIEHLNKQIQIDSMTLDRANKDYYELWEENQIFSSMLSEIEITEKGHEKLKLSWDKNK